MPPAYRGIYPVPYKDAAEKGAGAFTAITAPQTGAHTIGIPSAPLTGNRPAAVMTTAGRLLCSGIAPRYICSISRYFSSTGLLSPTYQ